MSYKQKSFLLVFGLILYCSSQNICLADQYYDQGLKLFKKGQYQNAVSYFEQSIQVAPWESGAFYYCALSYHYLKNFKKAAEKYGDIVERFPGTSAANNALAALKAVDPTYFTRKEKQKIKNSIASNSSFANSQVQSVSSSPGQDFGTIEGQAARVFYRLNGKDKVVDVRVNGRNTRAIFDPNSDSSVFSVQQLAALAVQAPKGSNEMRVEVQLGQIARKNFPIKLDDSGVPAKLGQSFLEGLDYQINETAKIIDLKRKGAAGSLASTSEIAFVRDGKDLIVNVEVNGRSTRAIFDPDADTASISTKAAQNCGLRVDDAEEKKADPNEGPQRGDPNWVAPEDRPTGPKTVSCRIKCGPAEKASFNVQISENGPKCLKIGPDLFAGWQYDIDYRSGRIKLSRR